MEPRPPWSMLPTGRPSAWSSVATRRRANESRGLGPAAAGAAAKCGPSTRMG